MQRSTDAILAGELEKLAATWGKTEFGAKVVGRVARKMASDVFTIEIEFDVPAEKVLTTAFELLDETGKIRDDASEANSPATVAAVVGSGMLNLNPALVTVEVIPLAMERCHAAVTGTAKEGLIKQHAGEKAARRFADQLRQLIGG